MWLPSLWLQQTEQEGRRQNLPKALHKCSLKQGENRVFTAREAHTVKSRDLNNYLPLCGPLDDQHNLQKHSMRKQQYSPER